MTLLLVDASYNAFYRIHATIQWYKLAHPDETITDDYDWMSNDIFKDKIRKMYFDSLKKIIKKHKISNENIYFCLDCKRKNIWRMKYYKNYKGKRKNNPNLENIFRFIYNEIIVQLVNEKKIKIISYNAAEADDIIAIIKNEIRRRKNDQEIVIITNDHDYLQLLDDKTFIYNLKNKSLSEKSSGDNKLDLFTKIILGDNSDNIEKVFSRCGKKTVLKYYNDKDLFEKELDKDEKNRERYNLNKKLIDFNEIPIEIKEGVIKSFFT